MKVYSIGPGFPKAFAQSSHIECLQYSGCSGCLTRHHKHSFELRLLSQSALREAIVRLCIVIAEFPVFNKRSFRAQYSACRTPHQDEGKANCAAALRHVGSKRVLKTTMELKPLIFSRRPRYNKV